ncbi:TolC family protein [Neoroseomonas oryzicola]|uniref:TolC family protein n=1 Tax=Neoroseomonas oryzicola TaxID=535904 RepID=A0A9X9WHM8_9PROT|nr:TolC family protein [Neoroseomonas oryzicola]MBR0659838.1 TolC family protein [Neoroseomonas oryzicola]NKE19510.1 TolC family protein [Neoroseomonas oryzicola]
MIRPLLIALAAATAATAAQAQTPVITPAPAPEAAAPAAIPAPAVPAAQAPLPITLPSLTLAEAEALLLERNLALAAARRGVDVARAQVLVADTSPAPTIGYNQVVGQWSEQSRLSGQYGARGVSPLNNAQATFSVLIETGGKRELRTRVAREGVSAAEAQLLDTLRGEVFALRQAFFAGLEARANLQVALANRQALNETEGLLRRQVQQGQIPEADLLRFQASRLPFEQDLAAAAQAYVAAVAQVAVQLGTDATRQRPQGASHDPLAPILAPLPFDLRGRLDARASEPPPREQLATAVANRPDVLAAARIAGAAAANARLAEAGRSRDVTLNASLGRTELSQDLPSGSRTAFASNQVGIGVSIPIFTRRLTDGTAAAATALQGQAEMQARLVLTQAQADVATAWASYLQARQLLTLTTAQALRRAEEAYQSTEAAYRAGGRTLLDVLDALRTLNATRVAANGARAQMLRALAGLEQASGVAGIAPRP